jgi:hypothetical protein
MAGDCGDVCTTIAIGAGNVGGSAEASMRSVSIPPAEAPTTTRCEFGITREISDECAVLVY